MLSVIIGFRILTKLSFNIGRGMGMLGLASESWHLLCDKSKKSMRYKDQRLSLCHGRNTGCTQKSLNRSLQLDNEKGKIMRGERVKVYSISK